MTATTDAAQARAGRVAQTHGGLKRTLSTLDYDDRRLLWVMLLEGQAISQVRESSQDDIARSLAKKGHSQSTCIVS